MAVPTPDILGRRQFTSNPLQTNLVAGTCTLSGTMTVGCAYSVTSDVDCFFLQTGQTNAATGTSNPLWSRERVEVYCSGTTTHKLSVFSSVAGSLYLTMMGSE